MESNQKKLDAAQEKLDAAIDQYLREVGWNTGVLTSYVLVGHQQWYREDKTVSGYPVIYKGGEQAYHITLGLLAYAETRTRAYSMIDEAEQ